MDRERWREKEKILKINPEKEKIEEKEEIERLKQKYHEIENDRMKIVRLQKIQKIRYKPIDE